MMTGESHPRHQAFARVRRGHEASGVPNPTGFSNSIQDFFMILPCSVFAVFATWKMS